MVFVGLALFASPRRDAHALTQSGPDERHHDMELLLEQWQHPVVPPGQRGGRREGVGSAEYRVRDRDREIEGAWGGVRVSQIDDPCDAVLASVRGRHQHVVITDVPVDHLRAEAKELSFVATERSDGSFDQGFLLALEDREPTLHDFAGVSQRPMEVDAGRGVLGEPLRVRCPGRPRVARCRP